MPDFKALQQLSDKYGDIEHDFKAATGYGFAALTQSEARTLTHFRPAEFVRDRIFAARDEKGGGCGLFGGECNFLLP